MHESWAAHRPPRAGPLRWVCQTAAFYAVLALFGVVFLGWSPPAALLRWVVPLPRAQRIGQAAMTRSFGVLFRIMEMAGLAEFDLSSIDALRDEGGLVIVANHPTLLDALLVISRLPRVVCIAKATLWDNPALGAGARLAGFIRNDAPLRLVREAARAMRDGNQLLIFPEGTRTASPPVSPFKPGFALMAQQAAAPVQTVILEASSPYIGKGWPLWRRPEFPLRYRARLGRRFEPEGKADAFSAGLEHYLRAELGGA